MPPRKSGEKSSEEPSAKVRQEIENNLLLHQALDVLQDIKQTQELNHVIAVQLRDHKTIERVDKLWLTVNNARWLLAALAALLSALFATHAIWKWP